MRKWLSVFLLLVYCTLQGEIFECAHFCQVADYLTADTILLLDIDDTLLVPKQMLGCDLWFERRLNYYCEMGCAGSEALERALAEWEAIRHLTQMELVESHTEALIRRWQDGGVCMMGFTTQGLALATRTVLQLKEEEIDLRVTAPAPDDCCVSVNGHTVLYRHGILFTSGTHKGEAFFAFCDKIGLKPQRVLFINDKATHLRAIEETAEKRGVPFTGLRYAYSDARKAAFDPKVADYQFAHSSFLHLLSDEEAYEALSPRS